MSDCDIDSSAYVEVHSLTWGHSDTVNALCFSPDGRYLASGGSDGNLLIWDVQAGQLLFRRLFNSPLTSLLWHPTAPDTVTIGCEDGEIAQVNGFTLNRSHMYSIEMGIRRKVRCLSYSPDTRCLAVGIGSEVHLTRERETHKYSGDWKLPLPEDDDDVQTVSRKHPVSIHFTDNGRQVIVTYFSHGVVCYDLKDKKYGRRWCIAPLQNGLLIGSSAVSADGTAVVIHNLNRGVDLYSIDDGKCQFLGTYEFEQAPSSQIYLQVSFVQGCRGIVCGTTTGNVCIWYKKSKELFQKLHHEARIIVAIASVERGSYSWIATGSAEEGQSTTIRIWRARMSEGSKQEASTFEDNVVDFIETVTSKPMHSRDAVRRGVALTYRILVWISLALILAWGIPRVPWTSMGMAMNSLIATIAEYPEYLSDALSHIDDGIKSLVKAMSDRLRTQTRAWLEYHDGDAAGARGDAASA